MKILNNIIVLKLFLLFCEIDKIRKVLELNTELSMGRIISPAELYMFEISFRRLQ